MHMAAVQYHALRAVDAKMETIHICGQESIFHSKANNAQHVKGLWCSHVEPSLRLEAPKITRI